MRTVYREKKYQCGEYLDVFIYPVYEDGKRAAGKRVRRRPSTKAQEALNKRHRTEKLARLLHANFTQAGVALTNTYDVQPDGMDDAQRQVGNYLKAVKRYVKKNGLGKLRYISVIEKGSRGGKYHHHIVMEADGPLDRDVLEKLWRDKPGHGYANTRRLQFNAEGLEGLAKYISKSPEGKKSWSSSRGLIDPEPQTRDGRISARKAHEMAENIQDCTVFEAMYPDYICGKAEQFHNEVNGGAYIFARMYRKDGVCVKQKKEKKGRKGKKK